MRPRTGKINWAKEFLSALLVLGGLLATTTRDSFAEDHFAQGTKLYQQKQYDAAAAQFNAALSDKVHVVTCKYYLGLCAQQMNQPEKAAEWFRSVTQGYPGTPEAGLAATYLKAYTAPIRPVVASAEASLPATIPQKTVKVPFSREKNWMVVSAEIGGRSIKMIYDTGAPDTIVHPNDFKGVIPEDAADVPVGSLYGTVMGKKFPADVKLGDIQKRINIIVAKFPVPVNIIGKSFFGDLNYEVDRAYIFFTVGGPPKSRLTASVKEPVADKFSVPYELMGEHMIVQLRVNDDTIPVVFDTGNAAGFVLSREFISTIPRLRTYFQGNANGRQCEKVILGPVQKTNVPCHLVSQPNLTGLIGPGFFGDRRYTIDEQNHLIHFQY